MAPCKEQAFLLANGCDIFIATPGRLLDMLCGSYINGVKTLSLENLSHTIYDEADELMSTSFANQIQKGH